MKKNILFVVVAVSLLAGFGGGVVGCGGSGSNGTSNPGTNPSTSGSTDENSGGKSFSESGSAITINDIVNGSSPSTLVDSSNANKEVATSTSASFYFGRFFYFDGFNLFSGSVKFKLKKQNDSKAYFSGFTLEHYSEITGLESHSNLVTSSTDLEVPSTFNTSTNYVEVSDGTKRFVRFDLDFGNNDFFGDIKKAGVIFSSDFTTMVGGDEANFFFIAQKVDSQPDAVLSSINGDWNALTFRVISSTGNISVLGTSTVDVSGIGGNGFTAFTGTNSDSGAFDGELSLSDATSGSFFFGYGSGSGTPTATEIDGGFLVSADQSLAVGYDFLNNMYFAVER